MAKTELETAEALLEHARRRLREAQAELNAAEGQYGKWLRTVEALTPKVGNSTSDPLPQSSAVPFELPQSAGHKP